MQAHKATEANVSLTQQINDMFIVNVQLTLRQKNLHMYFKSIILLCSKRKQAVVVSTNISSQSSKKYIHLTCFIV